MSDYKISGHALSRFCERTGQSNTIEGILELRKRLAEADEVDFSEICNTFAVLTNKRKARFLIWHEERIGEAVVAVLKGNDVVTVLTARVLSGTGRSRKIWWAKKSVHTKDKYLEGGEWHYVKSSTDSDIPNGVSGVLGSDGTGAPESGGDVEESRVQVR